MKSFSALLTVVACLLPTLGLAATVTLNPTADAYVQDGKSASKNYGSKTQLRVQTNAIAASNYDSYLKFDTSAATGEIASAKLRLYVPLSKADSVSTSVHAVGNTGWGETTLTWNNRPALGAALGSVAVNSTDYAWKEIDVTAYVQAEKAAGRHVISLGLHNAATSSAYVRVNSRNAHSNRPELVIVTAPAANLPPSVSLTAPVAGSSYTAPASVTLTASAADSDGTIASVAFYNGATLIGTGTFSGGSYTFTWSNIAAGSYSLTAVATDNEGASAVSAPVAVTITDPVPPPVAAGVYYVYADHLNTPRVIADGSNKVVWRWDSDPFGVDAANEDPDGDGQTFRYNLRFPGQYYDKETGLHYNYFRDYDPGTGRYVESDPLGIIPIDISPLIKQAKYLLGTKEKDLSELVLDHHAHDGYKVNHPYAYAISNPIIFSDFFGLLPYSDDHSPTPNNCSHYGCSGLKSICENTPNNPNMNCARKCLKTYWPGNYSGPIQDYMFWLIPQHPVCWVECKIWKTNGD